MHLVNLYSGVDLLDEETGANKTNSTCNTDIQRGKGSSLIIIAITGTCGISSGVPIVPIGE